MNPLEQLKQFTTLVVDTGDIEQMAPFMPRDATVHPSLILRAFERGTHAPLLAQAVASSEGWPHDELADRVLVRFGLEMLRAVPGRVSTQVDARLSFDCAATVARAHRIMALYEEAGIPRERVLIKIACTWEGIQAARILQHEGVQCHLTLLFSVCQAVVCGDAGVSVVSPFVGRIGDWHKKAFGAAWNDADHVGDADPGVRTATQIYTYYKKFGVDTEVMPASLRNLHQIHALAGCDLLAVPPDLLNALQKSAAPVQRTLDLERAKSSPVHAATYNEASFRYALNDDEMATEKLAEGIRAFAADAVRLDQTIHTLR